MFVLLAFSALLFGSAVYADPEYRAVDGSGHGAITFFREGNYYTAFSGNYLVDSFSGRFSYVLPLNGSFSWPTAFYDTDYEYENGNYSQASYGISPLYKLSLFGHPRVSPDDETSYPGITPGIGGTFTSVPAGKYCLEYKVKDESTLEPGLSGNVRDADCTVPVDVYIMDLAEKTRTVYMKQGDICRIDLSTIPASFPHENICYVSVTWSMMPMPGMPVDSDLYTDAACTAANMILPDTMGGGSKKWQAGSVPQYIYFKMPSNGYKEIYINLYAADSIYTFNLAQKTLTFTTTELYCHKARNSSAEFAYYEYVNNALLDKSYPRLFQIPSG